MTATTPPGILSKRLRVMGIGNNGYNPACITYVSERNDKHGAITTLDVPGAGIGILAGTFVTGINDDGAIVGSYSISRVTPRHGFVRDEHGAITTFDVPGAYSGTFLTGINEEGSITGIYSDTSLVNHGFVLRR
jgi:uncharacterized membrane protein